LRSWNSREAGKWKWGSPDKSRLAFAGLHVAAEQSVDYCLLGDSPVTMGKSMRRLQSSHEPSYILAS